jgi:hypothetical protein
MVNDHVPAPVDSKAVLVGLCMRLVPIGRIKARAAQRGMLLSNADHPLVDAEDLRARILCERIPVERSGHDASGAGFRHIVICTKLIPVLDQRPSGAGEHGDDVRLRQIPERASASLEHEALVIVIADINRRYVAGAEVATRIEHAHNARFDLRDSLRPIAEVIHDSVGR